MGNRLYLYNLTQEIPSTYLYDLELAPKQLHEKLSTLKFATVDETNNTGIPIPWMLCFGFADFEIVSEQWNEETNYTVPMPRTSVLEARQRILKSLPIFERLAGDSQIAKDYWQEAVDMLDKLPFPYLAMNHLECLCQAEDAEAEVAAFKMGYASGIPSDAFLIEFSGYTENVCPYSHEEWNLLVTHFDWQNIRQMNAIAMGYGHSFFTSLYVTEGIGSQSKHYEIECKSVLSPNTEPTQPPLQLTDATSETKTAATPKPKELALEDWQEPSDQSAYQTSTSSSPESQTSVASNPGEFTLSESKLRAIQPELFSPPLWADFVQKTWGGNEPMPSTGWKQRFQDHLSQGDSRAAVVINASKGIVAAYADELDCVALLAFDPAIALANNWRTGMRLLTVNTYSQLEYGKAKDLEMGPADRGVFGNFYPLIANLLSDNAEQIKTRTAEIGDAEWQRVLDCAKRAILLGIRPRDGRPLLSSYPAMATSASAQRIEPTRTQQNSQQSATPINAAKAATPQPATTNINSAGVSPVRNDVKNVPEKNVDNAAEKLAKRDVPEEGKALIYENKIGTTLSGEPFIVHTPQQFCCNCGQTSGIQTLNTPYFKKLVFSTSFEKDKYLLLALPYCQTCAVNVGKYPSSSIVKWLIGIFIWYFVALIIPMMFSEPSSHPILKFSWLILSIVPIVWMFRWVGKPKLPQTSKYFPVNIKEFSRNPKSRYEGQYMVVISMIAAIVGLIYKQFAEKDPSRIKLLSMKFSNPEYAKLFRKANAKFIAKNFIRII